MASYTHCSWKALELYGQGFLHTLFLVGFRRLLPYISGRVEKWPVGAIVAQACHASTAVLHLFRDDPNVVEYLKDVERMHKVVLEVTVRDVCLSV